MQKHTVQADLDMRRPVGPGSDDLAGLSVAIVHYWLVTWRGGEKVLRSILDLFPDADVYTLFHDPALCERELPGRKIYGSSLDRPGLRTHYQKLFPLYPLGIRSLNLKRRYDLVISSESGPAKGIRIPSGVPHLCYVHTPMRYCWDFMDSYLATTPRWARGLLAWRFERLRQWDRSTADNVDRFVANSHNVAERVRRHYGRSASVCTPPIAPGLFLPEFPKQRGEVAQRDHYLSFGAVTPYKNIDLLVDTFRALPERTLWVVGEGSERARLEASAGPNVRFLGAVEWEDLHSLILAARALLVPGEEDFGMIPPEVMAHGTPVIAYGRGGALETVIDAGSDASLGTGVFFAEPTVESLLAAIQRFEALEDSFDPYFIQDHARRFSAERFRSQFEYEVRRVLKNGRRG